jgi:hypothetical protein
MKRLIFLMKHMLLVNFLLIPVLGISQVTQEWVAKYNGSAGSYDGATAMVVDSAGNVYVTGFSFVSKSSIYDEIFKDIVTIKYNTAGELQWAVRYDGPANGADHPVDIALDSAGNVYVTGYSAGSETDGSDYRSRYDYVTIKYDTNGGEQWVARYNGPGDGWDAAVALEVDIAGNVYVTGSVYVAGSSYGRGTDYDYATIKYNTDGVLQWVKRYNGPSNLRDMASALAIDEAGNVYVTGSSLRDTVSVRLGAESAVTIKYDTNGNEVWVASYSGPENMSSVYTADLALDTVGNVYVTGRSSSELDSDDLPMYDYTTLKYDTTGALQWARFYDSVQHGAWGGDDFAHALAVDAEGNVYVTGQSGPREEDPDNAYVTIKYSTLGDELWIASFDGPGGPQGGRANAIALDAMGNVYVTGQSSISDGFSDVDYATIKYSPQGVQQWLMTYDGPGNYWDEAIAIGLDASGNVYVTGQSYVSDESVYYTVMDSEYATIKYSQTPCAPPTPSIALVPTSNVYTGGDPSTLYLGYGPQSVRLVASGGESYTWSPATDLSSTATAETVFTPTAAGTYTFTVTAYSGVCPATASVTIKVVDARCGTRGKVRVCHNGRILCLAPSAVKAHLRHHKNDRLGICSDEPAKEDVITVTIPLKVFPNPFGNWANVEFSLPVEGAYRLELYSANGKMLGVVAQGQGKEGQLVRLELKGEQLGEGIYYLKLITQDEVQTVRLVLKK